MSCIYLLSWGGVLSRADVLSWGSILSWAGDLSWGGVLSWGSVLSWGGVLSWAGVLSATPHPLTENVFVFSVQVANPTFGDTAGAMVVLEGCVVSQGDTGITARHTLPLPRTFLVSRSFALPDSKISVKQYRLSVMEPTS